MDRSANVPFHGLHGGSTGADDRAVSSGLAGRKQWASGTIRAIGQCISGAGLGSSDVTREAGMAQRKVLKAGHVDRLALSGLKPEQRGILPQAWPSCRPCSMP